MSEGIAGPVVATVDSWLATFDEHAPGAVEGLYVVGSAALADWQLRSDVDVVAFVADPTDAEVVAALRRAHDARRVLPARPSVDGSFLSWADVASPPIALQRPWTLGGEFRFDGECFEINPVTWYTLATHGRAVRGPAPGAIDVHLDARDRRTWVLENVDTYWRGIAGQVAAALSAGPERVSFDGATQEWCALGIARMAYTYETGDVTSKTAAGEWSAERHREHREVLRQAVELRRAPESLPVDRPAVERLAALLDDLVDRITR